jgi:hypothetical protein
LGCRFKKVEGTIGQHLDDRDNKPGWPTWVIGFRTFREHLGNIQGAFGEHSDDDNKPVWPTWAGGFRTFRERWGSLQMMIMSLFGQLGQ